MKKNQEINSYIENKEVRVIAYLLENLSQNSTDIYQKYCPFVELRKFDFDKYPKYVRILKHYRWKPLIVAENLEHSDVILWFDTSTIFRNSKKVFKVSIY